MKKRNSLFILIAFHLAFIQVHVKAGGLLLSTTNIYDEVYSDRGTGAKQDVSVWKPRVPGEGWYNLGYIFTNERSPPSWLNTMIVQETMPGMLAEPIGWNLHWNDKGSGGDIDGSIWNAVCPTGYYALGSVAIHIQNGQQVHNGHFPDFKCVHCSLVENTGLEGHIWTDKGSGAKMDATVFRVIGSPFSYGGYPHSAVRLADQVEKAWLKPYEEKRAAELLRFWVGDFDGDGRDDFISLSETGKWANVYLKTSTRDGWNKLSLPRDYDLDGTTTSLYVGDFDGDGIDDFLRVKTGDEIGQIFLSNGDGSTFTRFSLPVEFALDAMRVKIFVADFNGDGKSDLLIQDKLLASLLISNGDDGTFTRVEVPESFEEDGQLFMGDFNGDGLSDFIKLNSTNATLFLTHENITFTQITLNLPTETTNSLLVGDFNGDGRDDFLRQGDGVAEIFLSISKMKNPCYCGLFEKVTLSAELLEDFQANNATSVFYIADFNNDGKADIVKQPTNLAWDAAIIYVYLSTGYDEGNKTFTFEKLSPIPVRGDSTPLYFGDFNADGKKDFLKQEKSVFNDAKFSIPTIYLSLMTNQTQFDKIYYAEDLNAELILDANGVKTELGQKLKYDLINLAASMGFDTPLWDDYFAVSNEADDVIITHSKGMCPPLTIRLTDWTFGFGETIWGDEIKTEQVLVETHKGSLDNSHNEASAEQVAAYKTSVSTVINKYDLSTFTWGIDTSISSATAISIPFGVTETLTLQVGFSVGGSEQKGTVTASGENKEFSTSATKSVNPYSIQNYLVKIFGIKTNFDTSVVQIDARFAVTFNGVLRPDNYHPDFKGSQEKPNVSVTLGKGSVQPFYKALATDVQKQEGMVWDWNSMLQEKPTSYDFIKPLTNVRTFSTAQYFSLEAVQGTEITIEFPSAVPYH